MTWFPDETTSAIWALIVQNYSIILSTLWSTKDRELSLFDASFALTITSPRSVVVMVAGSCWRIYQFATRPYVGPQPWTRIIFTALLLPLWIALSLTLRFFNDGFVGGELCKGSTFAEWLGDLGFLIVRSCFPAFLRRTSTFIFITLYALILLGEAPPRIAKVMEYRGRLGITQLSQLLSLTPKQDGCDFILAGPS